MFGSTAATNDLIAWCRALKHGLNAGLSPVRVFRQQAKSGPSKLRAVADRIADRMETGESLQDSLKPEASRFPPIFVEMTAVGETAGRLPDVFGELEEYFQTVREARKAFVSMIAWPAMQWVAAILILTFMLFIIGMFGLPIDPLGLGLKGTGGAITFFVVMSGLTAGVVVGGLYVANNRDLRAKGEAFALNIPGIGGCFRCFAIGRFCMAAYMTMEAGLRADRCLGFSLRATANSAYTRHAAATAKAARKGEEVASILAGYGEHLFPADFLNAVQVGEDSGQLAEVMKKQAAYYQEEARHKLKWLARIAGGVVYAFVGLMLIIVIFKLAMMYLGQIDQATKWADDPNSFLRGD